VDVVWYFNRLRVMDVRELLHRIQERWTLRAIERAQDAVATAAVIPSPSRFVFCTATKPMLPKLEWDLTANDAHANELLEGRGPALGFAWQFTDEPRCWHQAPDTGAEWPTEYFGRIPHRHGNPFGDARVVWEPSRLQHLVSLALLGARPRYQARAVALVERQLTSWIEANPPYRGIHYVSAMECALRLIAVCHTVDQLRNNFSQPRAAWTAVLAIVRSHAQLIFRRLSLHSSAGNHTIAEAAGLIYAGMLFPELEHARVWRDTGRALLNREYQRQVLPDGGGIEQSAAYLKFITDLAELCQRLLAVRALDDAICAARIQAGRRFLDELQGSGSSAPALGDADGGVALSAFARFSSPSRRARRTRATFSHSGYTILRSRPAPTTQILFDHGPLGMPPLHAHGHADALAVTLRRGDADVLLDSGTYSYTDAPWRSYFRGTRAHNTVTVDDRDQALQTSPFMWRQAYKSRLVKQQAGTHTVLLASHEGFRHIGVQHWRGLVYDHGSRLVVWDYLLGDRSHELSLWWHFGIDVALDGTIVRGNAAPCSMQISGAATVLRHHGSLEPIAGWRSPRYGIKQPITTIQARFQGALPKEFHTVITLADGESLDATDTEQRHIAVLREWVHEA
jgi:Heparinase II/III-like protein/Heparinase II/III N-terminus